MEPAFWHEKWAANQIHFHEGAPNALLVRHLPAMNLSPGAHVFVPLCGKSLDVHGLLAHGFRVTGAELSPLAVEQLFHELSWTPQTETIGALRRYRANGLTVYAGDLFALTAEELGKVDAVYDRAALVALPSAMRERYAAHLIALTSGAAQLLITFEYETDLLQPPPHSVDAAEVHRHYAAAYRVTQLERTEIAGGMRGQHPVYEGAYLLSRI